MQYLLKTFCRICFQMMVVCTKSLVLSRKKKTRSWNKKQRLHEVCKWTAATGRVGFLPVWIEMNSHVSIGRQRIMLYTCRHARGVLFRRNHFHHQRLIELASQILLTGRGDVFLATCGRALSTESCFAAARRQEIAAFRYGTSARAGASWYSDTTCMD